MAARITLAVLIISLVAGIPEADAQCLTGVRAISSTLGPGVPKLRVDPAGTFGVLGAEFGRFWQCVDSDLGNNFIPGDPERRMAPAGTGHCASRDPEQAKGGWWQVAATTRRGINGFISGTGCVVSTCPFGDLCTVVEDWGEAGPPGSGDTAYLIGWRTSETPPDIRWWNLAKHCGLASCTVPFGEFPWPRIDPGSEPGTFTVRSDRDPGTAIYVQTPEAGPASQMIDAYDILFHPDTVDPGRDRHADCGGEPCWTLLARIPYEDAPLGPTPLELDCTGLPQTGYVALGLVFEGGSPGGPVPSQLVGRAMYFDCTCANNDGDGWSCGDCDDTDPNNWPGNVEVCDGQDNDCDGAIDDGTGDWYLDGDGDGFGDPSMYFDGCDPPDGYVANGLDCDDTDAEVNPTVVESCNGVDDDCDGFTDEGFPTAEWYLDGDGDGFGDAEQSLEACAQPEGYVANDLDCDDADAEVNPTAEERCNGVDDDCDGVIDDGLPTTPWYLDADADGYGDPNQSLEACAQPDGYVANDLDCDDTAASVNPEAAEVCNHVDDDCDGATDDGLPTMSWYRDADGDGFGTPSQSLEWCAEPQGYVANSLDCDDTSADVNPDATESCNHVDDDCDGVADDGLPTMVWYRDADGDGFGDPSQSLEWCAQPQGYAANGLDCDDTDAGVNPTVEETCNGVDDDCDGVVDDGLPTMLWYLDADGDGFGTPSQSLEACAQPEGYVANGLDCDDTRNVVYPGAPEICDGLNNDCNDPGWPVPPALERDDDGDLFSECAGDCNDADSAVHPGAVESCNQIDDDCDGLTDEDANGEDTDGDGLHNVCDSCPNDYDPADQNSDGDPFGDVCDTCPLIDDPGQEDSDHDGIGDACSVSVRIVKDDGVESYVAGGTLVYTIVVEPPPIGLSEDFDSGQLNDQWTLWSSLSDGRIRITGQWGTADPPFALWMDRVPQNFYPEGAWWYLNEAIWTVDLSLAQQAVLTFWTAEWEDEETPLPDHFDGHKYGDGIAISSNGQSWTTIFQPTRKDTGVWESHSIDLAAAAQAAGMTLGPGFRIKFQQYDNLFTPFDGRGYDMIEIDTSPNAGGTLGAAVPALGVLVEDYFPPELSCSWTCVATAGSSCTAGPVTGDIVDVVDVLGEVTYTAICEVSTDATGPLANTATVTLPPELIDPDLWDNSSTDVDEPTIDLDLDGRADGSDNCPGHANPDQGDIDGDGAGDVCDLCPSIANPAQNDEIACVETLGEGGDCLAVLIDLVDPAASGAIEIRDGAGAVFSATPFSGGSLPDTVDLAGLADGPGTLCVVLAAGSECVVYSKHGEPQLGIDGGCGALPFAVATAFQIDGCVSPTATAVLLDGSGSSDSDRDIVRFDWFEDYGTAAQRLLGSGERLELTLPVMLHRITLWVTDSRGASASAETAVRYAFGCWRSVDPLSIQLEDGGDGTLVRWMAIPGAASYDVIRGDLGQIAPRSGYIDLGPVLCLSNDVTSGESQADPDLPAPGAGFFYLVRRLGETPGTYGIGMPALPRSAGPGDCP